MIVVCEGVMFVMFVVTVMFVRCHRWCSSGVVCI